MPKRKTLENINLFQHDENIICDDTLRMELGSIILLCGNSEVGKSFLGLKTCANALNDGLKPFFWSVEDNEKALLERIKNVQSFYPFEANSLEFSTEIPEIDTKLSPETNLVRELGTLSDCNLVVLDTFSAFFSHFGFKDQNNQNDVQIFFNAITNIAINNNQSILLLHHLDKKGENIMGSSVIRNAPRLIYELDFATGEDKTTTTQRLLKVEKDSNNINDGERQKLIKVLSNSAISEALIIKSEDLPQIEINTKNKLAFMDNHGYTTMHENRGVFYLSSKKILDSHFYKEFEKNGRKYEFSLYKDSENSYIIHLKNDLLTQTHRGILDALFLYIKDNIDNKVIKQHQDEFWDLDVFVEPYKFLKDYLGKDPSSYKWLKIKFEEISRFAYDLVYTQIVDGKEEKITERDKGILKFDSVENITKENGRIVAAFKLRVRREYIKKLNTESTLAYDVDLAKVLINLKSLVVQDLIRFLSSFPDNSNMRMSFSEFCKIKAYADYKDRTLISRQKREIVLAKDELIKFGINVYGKNSPLKPYDDELLHNKYANSRDLMFVYKGNEKIKRYIKKKDPMNKLNIKANRYLGKDSLFDDLD